jgi:uncharacterized delta-60 repeat protein
MKKLLLSLGLASITMNAQVGELDTTFDVDGKLTINVGVYDAGNSVAIQSDGKIVIVGTSNLSDFDVMRLNPDGSFDTSFDADGKVNTNIAGSDTAYAVAIQPDGKILVAGYSTNAGNWNFTIVRYNTNGSLDTDFDLDGKTITDVGSTEDKAFSLAIQNDGKIVLAGKSGIGSNQNFALVRYNDNGSIDSSFGTNGIVTTDFGLNQEDIAYSVAIQSDGKIVAVGKSNGDFGIARYNSSGILDNMFDNDGKVITNIGDSQDTAYSIAVQNDDKLLVAGYALGKFTLNRYNNDGALDPSFDTDGITTAFDGVARSIKLQSDGKIVVGGLSADKLTVARYNLDGSLDTTFSEDGKNGIFFASTYRSYCYGVAIQQDNGIVAVGYAEFAGPNNDFAVARFNGNPPLGVPNHSETLFSIYPNPAQDQITIDCGNLANVVGYHIEIVNTLGQVVFNQPMNTQQYSVPLNTWSGTGVYFVKIYDASNNLLNTKKIILQ